MRPSGRAEITGGWRALARGSGFLLGMDLQVTVTAPNTLTVTVLRQPAAPLAAAALGPSGATSNGDSTAIGGTSGGAKAAPRGKKRHDASSDSGRQPPAKRQRGTAGGGFNAASAGQSAGAAAEAAHPQATSSPAAARTSGQGQQITPVGSMHPCAQPSAAAGSPTGVQSPPSLLSRLGSKICASLAPRVRHADPAPPLRLSTQAEMAAAAGMPADASNAAAADSPQQGRCMSAPSAVAAAAHQSTAKSASVSPAARKRAQRHSPDGAAADAAAPSRTRPASARKAARAAQVRLASNPDSSSDEEAAEPAGRHIPASAQPAAQSGAAMRCTPKSAAAAAAPAAADPTGGPAASTNGNSIHPSDPACKASLKPSGSARHTC